MSLNRINKTTGEAIPVCSGTYYADLPIGTIIPFAGAIASRDFLLCDGRAVSRNQFSELFAIIGTSFGSGDGVNTFNVPDLRETVPVGIGENGTATIEEHDVYTLGEFKDDQLQEHTHTISGSGGFNYTSGSYPAAMNSGGDRQSEDTGTTGRFGTTTHGKQLGVNYIIKAKSTAVPYDYKEYIDNKLEEGGFDAPFNLKEYIQNQNILSDIETIEQTTFPMTAPYDGELIAVGSGGGYVTFSINGSQYTVGSSAGMTNTSGMSIKKGDNLQLQALVGTVGFTARYYKLRDYSGR